MAASKNDRPRIALIGAPIDDGAGRIGCRAGPLALRAAEIERSLRDLGHEVQDLGDHDPGNIPPLHLAGHARHAAEIAAWARQLSIAAFETMTAGTLPVFLGGDHSLSMGTVNGVARWAESEARALFVLWLDAHADFNTPSTSPSGNMHGMPVAFFCGEEGFEGLLGEEPRVVVDPGNVHLLGIRSVDQAERDLVVARGVNVFDMRQIDEFGMSVLIRRILADVAAADGVLHVSLDVDFLDPAIGPGVGTTVPGGATYREAHLAMEMLYDSGLLASLDIVELNPLLDERSRTAALLVDLVASLFGRRVIDRPPPDAWVA